ISGLKTKIPINAKPTTTAAIPIQALLYAVITSKIINAIVSKIPTCSTTQSLIPAKSNGSTPFQRNKKSFDFTNIKTHHQSPFFECKFMNLSLPCHCLFLHFPYHFHLLIPRSVPLHSFHRPYIYYFP